MDSPVIQEAALKDAFIKELCSGRKFMEQMEQQRAVGAKAMAASMKGQRAVKGLGTHVASIPQHEYFTIREKYGDECWHDREFLKDFQRLEPEFASNKI